jgi:hypothetical protein
VADADEEVASSAAGSVLESEVSGNGEAMDIDPALDPPAPGEVPKPDAAAHHDPIGNIIRSAVPPPVPPREHDSDPTTARLNLNEFKRTAPFLPNNSGLKDMNNLKDFLPFPSAASSIPGQSSAPRDLGLPNPPKAPSVPEKVTADSYEYYMAYIRAYMAEWSSFNTKMLDHFNTRQNEVVTKLPNDWISHRGEDGFARYMRGVEEDVRVRAHWDVSWEKHRECMRSLGRVRAKAAKGHFWS